MKKPTFPLVIAVLCLAALPAAGSAIHDLQRGLPLEVEDTTTADRGDVQLQLTARYEHTDEGDDRLTVEPQVQYGMLENLQVEVSYPVIAGDADRSGSGDFTAAGLYRFLDEDGWRPSIAVRAGVELPTGVGSDGIDTDLRLVLTKTITDAASQDRLHLNVGWDHNAAADSDERRNRFIGVVGYSRKLSDETVFLADLVREQGEQDGRDSTLVEAGLLHQINEKLSIGAGIGFGLGDDSPDVRLTIGAQYQF